MCRGASQGKRMRLDGLTGGREEGVQAQRAACKGHRDQKMGAQGKIGSSLAIAAVQDDAWWNGRGTLQQQVATNCEEPVGHWCWTTVNAVLVVMN